MKKVVYILVISLFSLPGIISAADTLKIHLTYKHELNTEGQSMGFKTIVQQFYLPDGTFLREINYNDSTGQIDRYMFNFYKNNMLFTQEYYNSRDSLLYILKHEYDANGNEIILTRIIPKGKTLETIEKVVKSYSGKNITSRKTWFGNTPGAMSQYKYDKSGLLLQEKTVFKQIANADVKNEVKVYSRNSTGQITLVDIKGKDLSGKSYHFKEEYSYDEKGLVSLIKRLNIDGTPIHERIFKYFPSGVPSFYEEMNTAGKRNLMLQYEYKKHFMEKGTQVSRYENL